MNPRLYYASSGIAASLAAHCFFPGHRPGGYLVPAALGALGALLAELFGEKAGLYRPGQVASFVMSILGAMALMLLYSIVRL